MIHFIKAMVENGFPENHFLLSEKRVLQSWSDLMKQDIVKEYLTANNKDPETLDYLTTAELAYDYVEQHIPPQFTEVDEDGDEYGDWYDETYEMWNQAFVAYVEFCCLIAYEVEGNDFLERLYNIKKEKECQK